MFYFIYVFICIEPHYCGSVTQSTIQAHANTHKKPKTHTVQYNKIEDYTDVKQLTACTHITQQWAYCLIFTKVSPLFQIRITTSVKQEACSVERVNPLNDLSVGLLT